MTHVPVLLWPVKNVLLYWWRRNTTSYINIPLSCSRHPSVLFVFPHLYNSCTPSCCYLSVNYTCLSVCLSVCQSVKTWLSAFWLLALPEAGRGVIWKFHSVCVGVAAGKSDPVGDHFVCACVCVRVCAKNIEADGIKFPSAQFTPCGPRLSQCGDIICVCLSSLSAVRGSMRLHFLSRSLFLYTNNSLYM